MTIALFGILFELAILGLILGEIRDAIKVSKAS